MKPILEVNHIGKKYRIRHNTAGYLSLRERLGNAFQPSASHEDFWALNDVSFTVNQGESIGIIGRNGAGKSTLLKILSKITPPSRGKIITRGRIASLLEVGTGFHPELTGRENIFFNGSLLGMKRKEIALKFDEIVDFSGTERFLDTPLKHYSSGMQLRLAFSVAAFLEPEILIIDEVLAVGDVEFQKKCLGKMEDVSKSGRTILFVSHNMAAVENLCEHALLLDRGALRIKGKSTDIIRRYISNGDSANSNGEDTSLQRFTGNGKKTFITQLEFLSGGLHSDLIFMGDDLEIRLHFRSSVPLESPLLGIIIYDALGTPVCFFNNKNYGYTYSGEPITAGMITLHIPDLNLVSGFYTVDVHFANLFEDVDVKKACFKFHIQYKHFSQAGEPLNEKYNRIFLKDVKWKIDQLV